MQALLAVVLLLNVWGPEERSGLKRHPVMDFDNLIIEDTSLACDVLHYNLVLDVDIPAETLSAAAQITLKMLEPADSVALHFVGMEISGINEGANARVFQRVDSFLIVALGRTAPAGEVITLAVSYHGKPTRASGGFGRGMYIDPSSDDDAVTYTCNAPWAAKYWFPCQDNPADKATMEMSVTVPEGYEVISNGTLASADRSGSSWTFHWQEHHPIATYLIAFAASKNYALTTDTASIDGTPLPIYHWVLRKDSAQVTHKLMRAKEIVEYFSELFYPYPFLDEKYAHVHFPVRGAMENQTCTHINTHISWGDWDVIVAHELSHSWWGNSTTCRKLKHMWLNEGFATYCEALWIEHRDGPAAYQEYYEQEIAGVYLGDFQSRRYPILDPPWERIYSPLTYEKPASVLHMLRRIVGDDDFFTVLRTYGERYQDSTALSEDFEAVVDEVTGQDYSWFFNQWLRAPGHPEYLISWRVEPVGDSARAILRLRQTQEWPPDVPVFRMPVEFGLVEGADTSFVSFIDSLRDQSFEVTIGGAPDEVIFDPHGNLLCEVEYSGIAEDEFYPPSSFVCSSISRGRVEYACGADQLIDIILYDVSGRRVECWKAIPPRGFLDLGHLPGGVYFLEVVGLTLQAHRVVVIK
jgi:aminopeptidase N